MSKINNLKKILLTVSSTLSFIFKIGNNRDVDNTLNEKISHG